jgi:hypothetical protein
VTEGKCSYCDRNGVDIVKAYPSESTHSICAECNARVVMLRPDQVLRGLKAGERYELTPHTQLCLLRALDFIHSRKCDIMAEEPLFDLPDLVDRTCERERAADYNRFRSLMRSAPADWMPIKVKQIVRIGYRLDPIIDFVRVDGVHRICAAAAWGVDAIPAYIVPPAYKPKATPVYQTLVFPDGLIPGQRPADRWRHMPDCLLGRDVLDLGCNSARGGIFHALCSPQAHYHGYDKDADAIEDGRACALAWDVQEHVHLAVADVSALTSFPRAFAVWLLSAAKVIPFDAVIRAVRESGAERFLLETHNLHDDPDSQRFLDLDWHWNFLGCSSHVENGPKCRRLFAGVPCP